jgi:hypothetical protein
LAGEGIAVGGPITNGSIEQRQAPGGAGAGQPRQRPCPGPEDATAAGAPWPKEPADPALLADPESAIVRLPADPEPVADLWASGVPEPPAQQSDDPHLATADQVVDADQQGRERLWLAGFDQLPLAHPGCPRCTTTGLAAASNAAALPGPRRGVSSSKFH